MLRSVANSFRLIPYSGISGKTLKTSNRRACWFSVRLQLNSSSFIFYTHGPWSLVLLCLSSVGPTDTLLIIYYVFACLRVGCLMLFSSDSQSDVLTFTVTTPLFLHRMIICRAVQSTSPRQ